MNVSPTSLDAKVVRQVGVWRSYLMLSPMRFNLGFRLVRRKHAINLEKEISGQQSIRSAWIKLCRDKPSLQHYRLW
jgi:hypothetical protein